ncbi:MAG: cyclic nucleotide-binding domain-containing protein [Blastocatellia bacterium]|nr:cyclic nucleotide-binding domain-containing protein [Blastocatellia bacterium]
MNRKLMLSKDALLWEAGDPARNIAIVDQGKLGVRTEKGIIGQVLPKMILGETAIFTLEGQSPRRTATVYALEDNTVVTEYSAVLVKQLFDSGDPSITPMIFNTIISQIGKHCVLIISANKNYTVIQTSMGELLKGIAQASRELPSIRTWDAFIRTFRFLCSIRDNLSGLSDGFLTNSSEKAALVDRASATAHELLSSHGDMVAALDGYLRAEKSLDDWFER